MTLNVIVFVVMLANGVDAIEPTVEPLRNWGANFGPQTLDGQWWRLFTSMFLHAGIIHLAFNMYVLWDAGRLVERLLGNTGFVLMYVVSGLLGSLASVGWNPFVTSVGASGAVFGVYGALLGYMVMRRGSVPGQVLRAHRNAVLVFIGFNILYGMGTEGIDMAAHLGGLAAGFVCSLAMSLPMELSILKLRPKRNAAIAIGKTILILLITATLPKSVTNYLNLLHEFDTLEKTLPTRFNSARESNLTGAMNDSTFVDFLEKEIIPPYAA